MPPGATTEHAWDSRRPDLNAPYFAEYLPLLSGEGVARYEDRFAVRRYFVPAQQPLDEAAYLASLLRLAETADKQPVLGFSRSLGRVGAIKRVLGGHHVVMIRDPIQQWLSARSQRLQHGSPYFELGHFMILALASRLSVAGRIARWLNIPHLRFGSFGHHYRSLRRRFEPLDDELSYRAFIAVYMLSYMQALRHADVVDARINIQAIHREVSARILREQSDTAQELDLEQVAPGHDYDGPTATGAPRRA